MAKKKMISVSLKANWDSIANFSVFDCKVLTIFALARHVRGDSHIIERERLNSNHST